MQHALGSWNRIPRVRHRRQVSIASRSGALPAIADGDSLIAFGNGRSYGDVCLNPGGSVVSTRGLDRFIAFDRASGELTAEAGCLIAEVLDLVVPMGWFLPVTPGTRFVTLGGAVANDVHGKNHHRVGSFGHHVVAFELLRSDGTRCLCTADQNADLFAATIGGLGLTGLVTWVKLRLVPISNAFMVTQTLRFGDLAGFWALNAALEPDWPYTVAWIDCTSREGRGLIIAGDHAPMRSDLPVWRERRRSVAIDPPVSLVNGLSLRAFNTLYYHRPRPRAKTLMHYVPYFYPLDAIGNWNRIYGASGFYQYQCVLPPDAAKDAVAALLSEIAVSGSGSFLAVLKTFGDLPSRGLLSFARQGATLALDFPNAGAQSERLFARLDAIVRAANGALYPAKDARMSPDMFRAGYPAWERFADFIDPAFSSGFWRRVTGADHGRPTA